MCIRDRGTYFKGKGRKWKEGREKGRVGMEEEGSTWDGGRGEGGERGEKGKEERRERTATPVIKS